MSFPSKHDQICSNTFCAMNNLFRRMSYQNFCPDVKAHVGSTRHEMSKFFFKVLFCIIEDRVNLDRNRWFRRTGDGKNQHLRFKSGSKFVGKLHGSFRLFRPIIANENRLHSHNHTPSLAASDGCGMPVIRGRSDSRFRRWCGIKKALAITVGITALPITAATKNEYCAGVMIP